MSLCHCVQRTTVLEPFNLAGVQCVRKHAIPGGSILGMNPHCHWLTDGKLSAKQIDLVVWVDSVVICRIHKGQGKHTLLLQVGFVLSKCQ